MTDGPTEGALACPVCGTVAVPGARFCFACGSALGAPDVGLDVETERRVVTVLFGDLSDFTSWSEDLDPERVGVVTDRVLASLAGIVTEYGGHVDKLVGDGIMAVFGAPTAHEDDAERAVRAAAKMQAAVRRLVAEESGGGRQLGLRVGLNTGEVVAGVQAHLTYTVVGDTVNTASRLSDAAGVGAVVAGRDTAAATMSIASWRALQPMRLKGKREPVEAFELVGLRPAGATRLGLGDEAPFLGRDAEIGLLIGRLGDVAARGLPRAVLVTGEAGVGKTRLAQELTRFAGELPGTRVLWGRSAPYGEGRDLAAVSEMVRTACGIGESDDVETARQRVIRTVARLDLPTARPTGRQLAEQLGRLLGLEAVDEPPPREAASPGVPAGGDTVREAVAAFFSGLAQQAPLVLVLDDLHWATPSMVDGLLHVASRTHGQVLLLCLGRGDMLDVPTRPDWWQELHQAELLPLPPLEPSAAERLLRAYLGPGDVDAAVREALLDRAQGNPFFLAELLRLLFDRGALRREQDRWVLQGELPEDVLPAGVQAVLAARIDDLPGPAKGVLRDASVLGLRATLPGLEAVGRASGHGDPEVVRSALDVLVTRRLLEPEGEDGAFVFTHTLVRDVAYAGLAKAERARRHAAVAKWAQAMVDPRGWEPDVLVASQGERAVRLAAEMSLPPDDPAWTARAPALEALLRLGHRASSRDDHSAAHQLLRRALDLLDPRYGGPVAESLEAPLRIAHARALTSLRRLGEAEEELQSSLRGSWEDADSSVRADALLVLGDLRHKRGDLAGARQAFVSALAAASSAGADQLGGEAIRQLGLLDYFQGKLRSAEQHFSQAHALAVQIGDVRGAGWALQQLAWSATTRGDYDLAASALDQAAEVFAAQEDTGGLSWVAGTQGFVRLLQGRFADARELAGTLLPYGEQAGERWGVAALLTIDAIAAAELGDVVVGANEAERARLRFAELDDPWGQAMALVAAGMSARGAGLPERAVTFLETAVALTESGGFPVVGALATVALGYARLDDGDVDGAEASVIEAEALLAGLDLEPPALLGAQVLEAQVLRHRERFHEALAMLDQALSAAGDAQALLFPRRQALAHRADLLLELERPAEALKAAQAAVASQAEDVRSRVVALRSLGCSLRAVGDEDGARRALEEALEVARSTDQRSEIAATQRLISG
jgi:class 3 adenylate cyclase/tetratricopeptide (TPR) repeat protein